MLKRCFQASKGEGRATAGALLGANAPQHKVINPRAGIDSRLRCAVPKDAAKTHNHKTLPADSIALHSSRKTANRSDARHSVMASTARGAQAHAAASDLR